MESVFLWGGLIAGLIILTWADYAFEKNRELTTKIITLRVLIWIGLALSFNVFVLIDLGHTKALEFLTGYLVEYSLSVDNLFVFIMLFRYFGVTEHQELKALQWGIYGAMLLRLVFILFGITLIHLFHPVIYAFGALLLWTSYKMLKSKDVAADPGKMVLLRILPKFFQMQKEYHGDRFFVKKAGRLWATPMIALVIAVESSDVMFAIDSIPAILAITTDPFIVFSSNIFAVLGLRSLFFLLSKLLKLFHHLKYGVALILAFVGVKMMLSDVLHIPIAVSLGTIAIILSVTILSSILARNKNKADKKKL